MTDQQNILIVDDAKTNAMLLSVALEKAGYRTTILDSGKAAIEFARTRRPDLILLDWMMPEMNGLETCQLLKQCDETRAIPVIFVTSIDQSDCILQAFRTGGADYVVKPVRIDELVARVSVHLRLRRVEAELIERNAELERVGAELSVANEQLKCQSRVDSLTGLLNRGAWDQQAATEHERSERCHRPYSILMIDVDHFKFFNDSMGHQAGDECLCRIGESITQACRPYDIAGRYGGEEFIILAPETREATASLIGERIRTIIWNHGIAHPRSAARRITVSIGVCERDGGELSDVIRKADAALYRAKCGGRNMVFGSLKLPQQATSTDPGASEEAPREQIELIVERPGKILVVDDNRTNRMVCRGALEKDGFEIREACDGIEALEVVSEHRPDVIILDVMMPRMDGFECARQIKANVETSDIPIIMVTAKSDSEDILEGFKSGAEEYLVKPVRTLELATRVRSMCRLSRERGDLMRSYQLRAEQIRVLVSLVEFARNLGSAVTLDEIARATLLAAAELCASRRIAVLMTDPRRQYLTVLQSVGIEQEIARQVRSPVGHGYAGRAFTTNRAFVLNTTDDFEYAIPSEESALFCGAPSMSTPLSAGGETFGVLTLSDRIGGRPFEDCEFGYIDLLAGIAGACLQSALNRQARDESRDLIVMALARLAEHRDNDTARHVERVTEFSILLAKELQRLPLLGDVIDSDFMNDLQRAAALHDIGKVAIPDEILFKPARLTLQEMEVIRSHTEIGAATLRPIIERIPNVSFLHMAEQIIRSHHERFDGHGYPDGLSGKGIPLAARIVALADVYDALTTTRPYKEALDHDAAIKLIKSESGKHFDPIIVDALMKVEDQFRELHIALADARVECAAPKATHDRPLASAGAP